MCTQCTQRPLSLFLYRWLPYGTAVRRSYSAPATPRRWTSGPAGASLPSSSPASRSSPASPRWTSWLKSSGCWAPRRRQTGRRTPPSCATVLPTVGPGISASLFRRWTQRPRICSRWELRTFLGSFGSLQKLFRIYWIWKIKHFRIYWIWEIESFGSIGGEN